MRPELGAPSPLERQGVLALRCCWRLCVCSRRASRPISAAPAPEWGHTLAAAVCSASTDGQECPGIYNLGEE